MKQKYFCIFNNVKYMTTFERRDIKSSKNITDDPGADQSNVHALEQHRVSGRFSVYWIAQSQLQLAL